MIARYVQNQNTKTNKITLQITQTCKQHKKTKINKVTLQIIETCL